MECDISTTFFSDQILLPLKSAEIKCRNVAVDHRQLPLITRVVVTYVQSPRIAASNRPSNQGLRVGKAADET